jgi:hypothetical protein
MRDGKMRKAFRAAAFAVTVFAAGLFAQEARAAYGAIAYSPTDGIFGHARAGANRAIAEVVALQFCRAHGGRSCRVVYWFRNSCAALASGRRHGWGVYGGGAVRAAQAGALAACRAHTAGCRIRVWVCSG